MINSRDSAGLREPLARGLKREPVLVGIGLALEVQLASQLLRADHVGSVAPRSWPNWRNERVQGYGGDSRSVEDPNVTLGSCETSTSRRNCASITELSSRPPQQNGLIEDNEQFQRGLPGQHLLVFQPCLQETLDLPWRGSVYLLAAPDHLPGVLLCLQ